MSTTTKNNEQIVRLGKVEDALDALLELDSDRYRMAINDLRAEIMELSATS